MPKTTKAKKAVVKKTVKTVAKRLAKKGKISGKGDFFGDLFKKGRALLGQGLHKGIDFLSDRAKGLVGSIVGHGDYNLPGAPVHTNSLYAGAAVVPQFKNTADHGNIVCHREPIAVISSTTGFGRASINVNPGLTAFPWLSNIAPAWQRWKLHGAIVEWIPRVPDINVNAGGSVVLSTRYDLTTAAPQSIQEAEIAFGSIVGRPMDKMAMPIECKNSMNPTNVLNTRFGPTLPVGANAQFFDHCIIDICYGGQASSGTVIGEVFITYDIEFMMPTAEHLSGSTNQTVGAYAPISTANPQGAPNSWIVRTGSSLPLTIVSVGTQVSLDFDDETPLPVGSTWLVSYVSNVTGGNITTNTGASLGADFAQFSPAFKTALGADVFAASTGTPSTSELVSIAVQVVGQTGNQQIVYSGAVLAAAVTGYASMLINPLLSTLSAAELMMRRRHPSLYELEDRLELKGICPATTAVASEFPCSWPAELLDKVRTWRLRVKQARVRSSAGIDTDCLRETQDAYYRFLQPLLPRSWVERELDSTRFAGFVPSAAPRFRAQEHPTEYETGGGWVVPSHMTPARM